MNVTRTLKLGCNDAAGLAGLEPDGESGDEPAGFIPIKNLQVAVDGSVVTTSASPWKLQALASCSLN